MLLFGYYKQNTICSIQINTKQRVWVLCSNLHHPYIICFIVYQYSAPPTPSSNLATCNIQPEVFYQYYNTSCSYTRTIWRGMMTGLMCMCKL